MVVGAARSSGRPQRGPIAAAPGRPCRIVGMPQRGWPSQPPHSTRCLPALTSGTPMSTHRNTAGINANVRSVAPPRAGVIRTMRSFPVSEVRLAAEIRTDFGKGGARRTRRAGNIPAVLYGHGAAPKHVALPAREFANAVRHGGANVLLTLALEGQEQLAIPKAIQRHPIRGEFEHVDLLAVRRGEKVSIDVPLAVTGEVVSGGLLNV